jgi:hypothetical protein
VTDCYQHTEAGQKEIQEMKRNADLCADLVEMGDYEQLLRVTLSRNTEAAIDTEKSMADLMNLTIIEGAGRGGDKGGKGKAKSMCICPAV